jgi:hypothetical protein
MRHLQGGDDQKRCGEVGQDLPHQNAKIAAAGRTGQQEKSARAQPLGQGAADEASA